MAKQIPELTPEQAERFWKLVDKSGDCWIWRGCVRKTGYGVFSCGQQWPAHRVAYKLYYGDCNPSLSVCHHCDIRTCVNPSHLFLGTAYDNSRDAWDKGRTVPALTWYPPSTAEFNKLVTRAGGPAKVARAMGISRQQLYLLRTGKAEIRPMHALAIRALAAKD